MTIEYCVIYDNNGPCDEIYTPETLKSDYESFFRSAGREFFIKFYLGNFNPNDLIKYYGMNPKYIPKFNLDLEKQKQAFFEFIKDANLNNPGEILKIEFYKYDIHKFGNEKIFKFKCKMITRSLEIIKNL